MGEKKTQNVLSVFSSCMTLNDQPSVVGKYNRQGINKKQLSYD